MSTRSPSAAELSFLPGIPEGAREALARLALPRNYPKGNMVFYHGEPCATIDLLCSGRIKLSLVSDEGREVALTVAHPPAFLGLDAALTGGGYFGTAVTLTECQIAKIPTSVFDSWLKEFPEVQPALLSSMCQALRHAYEKIGEQALLPVKQRLLSALLELARKEGTLGTGGELAFVRPTHQELADLIGTSRTVISRILKELIREQEGIAAQGNVLRVYLDDLVLEEGFGG